MARYLVTGGSGFIGSHIVKALAGQGEDVCVLDIRNRSLVPGVNYITDSILDRFTLKDVMKGMDYVLHQAALTSVPRSIGMPADYNEVNIEGTLNVLLAARDAGVKRVVYASSSSVYGAGYNLLSIDERVRMRLVKGKKNESDVCVPVSPYALTKHTGEQYCKMFYDLYGLETVSLRYFNVYGPGQVSDAVIPKFIKDMPNPIIYGDGNQTRDFTFVDDVVAANLLACTADVAGESFNIGTGISTTVSALAWLVGKLMNVKCYPECVDARRGDAVHSCADIEKAREMLGYDPKVKLEEGLKRTIAWVKF